MKRPREKTREERIRDAWNRSREAAFDRLWRGDRYYVILRNQPVVDFRRLSANTAVELVADERVWFHLEVADPPSRHWRVMCGDIMLEDGHRW